MKKNNRKVMRNMKARRTASRNMKVRRRRTARKKMKVRRKRTVTKTKRTVRSEVSQC